MTAFDDIMTTILPEDWRSWMVIGLTRDGQFSFPAHLQVLIPSIGASDWQAAGKPFPGFQAFWYGHMNFAMLETFIAPINDHSLAIACTANVDGGIARVSTLLAWNLKNRNLFFVGPYIGTGAISDYVTVASPRWTKQA